jgi:hypothetical protein
LTAGIAAGPVIHAAVSIALFLGNNENENGRKPLRHK